MYVLLAACLVFSFIPYFWNFNFVRVISLVGRYFYNTYIHVVKKYEIVFSFNIKDNYIFPCLHNIKLSYNILKCFSALSIRMRMPTYNSKHGRFFFFKVMKTLIQMYRVVPIMKRENKKDIETTYLPSSSPRPSSYTRTPPSSSSLLSTYFPIAL